MARHTAPHRPAATVASTLWGLLEPETPTAPESAPEPVPATPVAPVTLAPVTATPQRLARPRRLDPKRLPGPDAQLEVTGRPGVWALRKLVSFGRETEAVYLVEWAERQDPMAVWRGFYSDSVHIVAE